MRKTDLHKLSKIHLDPFFFVSSGAQSPVCVAVGRSALRGFRFVTAPARRGKAQPPCSFGVRLLGEMPMLTPRWHGVRVPVPPRVPVRPR